jgi:hypothetical protein
MRLTCVPHACIQCLKVWQSDILTAASVDDVPDRATFRFGCSCLSVIMLTVLFVFLQEPAQAAGSRSTYIPYDVSWFGPPDFRAVAFDQVHQQIFTAWSQLDRVDVLSAADYHLIRSIVVPSPTTVDISPERCYDMLQTGRWRYRSQPTGH